jgi:branched-chain amino acid aminotransferase
MKVWMDGKLLDTENATINVYDHGLLYGDGVFEGIRVYNSRIFKVAQHVDRLFDGAKAIRLEIPFDRQAVLDALTQTVAANGMKDGYIRLVVTRGDGTLGLNPFTCAKPRVFIIADKIQLYPQEMYASGMSVIIASTVRNHPNAVSPRVKSLNYLNNILAKIEAIDAKVPEAIMLNTEGKVAEATGDNIFVVRKGVLTTPPLSAGILEGITRDTVMDLARKDGLPLAEEDLTRYDLYTSSECFLTGTAAEVIAVTRIDGRPVGDGKPGPVTRRLAEAFHKLVRASE